MVRTIQAISILALVAAGLIFAHCITGALQDDLPADQAAAPTAIERFMQSRNGKSDTSDHLPPLVEQAQAFALYLNPPRAPVVSASAPKSPAGIAPQVQPGSDRTSVAQVKPPASSPKFELHGISYYRQKPDQSMALVLEPGGTRRWVHQGEQLGHLTIERIDGNSVVCRDGAQTQVVALAPTEAITKYARSIKDIKTISAPKQAQNKDQNSEVPPPAPGIRQMPLSRIAAVLGQS